MKSFFKATLLLIATNVVADSREDEVFNFEDEFSDISTITRLKTHIDETPGSSSVLTGEKLKRLGIVEVPEALRLITGMFVARPGGPEWVVSYQGTSVFAPRRMSIFVDGLSFYQPGYARIQWSLLPESIDDIERIEVTRGPNSASWGANAFLGVVNIITKSIESRNNKVSFIEGNYYSEQRVALASDSGFLSVTQRRGDGYDSSNLYEERHDSYKNVFAKFGYKNEFDNHTLSLRGGYSDGDRDEQFVHPSQQNFPDVEDEDTYINFTLDSRVTDSYSSKISITARNTKLNQEWRSCFPSLLVMPELFQLSTINYDLAELLVAQQPVDPATLTQEELALVGAILANAAAAAQDPDFPAIICGDTNQNYRDGFASAEYQGTYVDDNYRVVFGAGFKEINAKSRTFLGGKNSFSTAQLFGNLEYRFSEDTIINIGGMYEYDSDNDYEFTPRVALNYRASEDTWLRAVYSEATRTPDLWERKADWTYSLTNMTPSVFGETGHYYRHARANTEGLVSEKINSFELGMRTYFAERSSFVDVRIFNNELYDLISERPAFEEFMLTNDSEADLYGIEIESGIKASNYEWSFSYAYLDNESDTFGERTAYAKNSGSVVGSYFLDDGSHISFNAFYQEQINSESFKRADITYGKYFSFMEDSDVYLKASLIHFFQDDIAVFSDNGQPIYNQYDDSTQIRIFGEYIF